jgi:hypothetical protein
LQGNCCLKQCIKESRSILLGWPTHLIPKKTKKNIHVLGFIHYMVAKRINDKTRTYCAE